MGQVARHKAAKADARSRILEPVYRVRDRERALQRARRSVERELERLRASSDSLDVTALLPKSAAYQALLARVRAHNLAAGVYGPGHSGALH